jgi:hypothetical protein
MWKDIGWGGVFITPPGLRSFGRYLPQNDNLNKKFHKNVLPFAASGTKIYNSTNVLD